MKHSILLLALIGCTSVKEVERTVYVKVPAIADTVYQDHVYVKVDTLYNANCDTTWILKHYADIIRTTDKVKIVYRPSEGKPMQVIVQSYELPFTYKYQVPVLSWWDRFKGSVKWWGYGLATGILATIFAIVALRSKIGWVLKWIA